MRRARLPAARFRLAVGGAVALLCVALAVAPWIGSSPLDPRAVWAAPWNWHDNVDAAVLFVARLPRVLLAALVGGSLALAGATFQSLLRNPLATPYTLGIAAGAMLATFLTVSYLPGAPLGELTQPAAALAGALVCTALVLGWARRGGGGAATVVLLAGVTLNLTIGAVVMLLHYLADYTATARMVRWTMGELDAASYRMIALAAAASAPAWWSLLRRSRDLNLLSLGLEEASAQGVDGDRALRRGLLWSCWLTGWAVALAGPIGFVGIIVPHAVRGLAGADARIVMPASLFAGAAFLVVCDAVARTLLAPADLPIGVITASLGGPFFLLLLRRMERG